MSQYLDWNVGDKVVCVDDDPYSANCKRQLVVPVNYDLDGLRAGETYTIRLIGPDRYTGAICIWVNEINRQAGFNAGRFRKVHPRKVHPRKTSIAIFEQMLHPSKQRERA